MIETVTHLAGPVIRIEDRVLQRCAICGDVLVDSQGCTVPWDSPGYAPLGTWEEGRLVRITPGEYSRSWKLLNSRPGDQLPFDSCIVLVE